MVYYAILKVGAVVVPLNVLLKGREIAYHLNDSDAKAYFVLQSFVAITLLEIVNYVEHYGLGRQQTGDGPYEPVKPTHSWNADNWLTNKFLFNLQRHSDHHYKPGRRYQLLRHFEESPQLPTGYGGMILIAAIPPLWRRIMDPKVSCVRPNQPAHEHRV